MKSLEVHFAVCDYPTGTNTTEKRIVQVHFLEDGTKVMQTAPIGWKVVPDDQWNAMKRYDFSEAPHFAP